MPKQQNIEYKSSWHENYLKWVCGFANAHRTDGFILIKMIVTALYRITEDEIKIIEKSVT
jgi:hypothetical protein